MLLIMNANLPNGSSQAALVLFCRKPEPGIGKQRLATDLGAQKTAILAQKLLDAAVEDAKAWPGPVIVAPADAADEDWAASLIASKATVIAQQKGNLGQRLNAVDEIARQIGHNRLIYIGSDSPAMREADYTAAREALYECDVVLMPAEDGGVTLMGTREPWPDLAGLRWSSNFLAADLERVCQSCGLSVQMLEPGYDIDRAVDLARLLVDLATDKRPARSRLYAWLNRQYE